MPPRRAQRSPTPPPVILPFEEDDASGDPHSWYWKEHGGGMVLLNSNKYKGKKINEIGMGYLLWCRKNCATYPNWKGFHAAFDYYQAGLQDFAGEEYARFIVPLGKKHKGKTIQQCRDKDWFRWLCRRKNLTNEPKYELFFSAVHKWLENPRHQEVKRDVGEALANTEYADDLDLENEDIIIEEEPTSEDLDFIDDSGVRSRSTTPDSDGTSSDSDEELVPAVTDNEDAPDAITLALAEDEESEDETRSRDVVVHSASTSGNDTEDETEMDSVQKSVVRSIQRDQNSSDSDSEGIVSEQLTATFLVEDTSTDDNGSYDNSNHRSKGSTPSPRMTRSRTKARRQGLAVRLQASSSVSRRGGRKIIESESESELSSEHDNEPLPTLEELLNKPPVRRGGHKIVLSEDDSEGEDVYSNSPRTPSPRVARTCWSHQLDAIEASSPASHRASQSPRSQKRGRGEMHTMSTELEPSSPPRGRDTTSSECDEEPHETRANKPSDSLTPKSQRDIVIMEAGSHCARTSSRSLVRGMKGKQKKEASQAEGPEGTPSANRSEPSANVASPSIAPSKRCSSGLMNTPQNIRRKRDALTGSESDTEEAPPRKRQR